MLPFTRIKVFSYPLGPWASTFPEMFEHWLLYPSSGNDMLLFIVGPDLINVHPSASNSITSSLGEESMFYVLENTNEWTPSFIIIKSIIKAFHLDNDILLIEPYKRDNSLCSLSFLVSLPILWACSVFSHAGSWGSRERPKILSRPSV